MRRLLLGVIAALALTPALALAQDGVAFWDFTKPVNSRLVPVTASVGLPVNIVAGSLSASFSGFTPTAGATAPLTATSTSSDVTLPAGTTVIVTNYGVNDAFVRVQAGAGTAVTTDLPIKAGAAVGFAVGSATHISAITAAGTTSLQIQGGTGGPAGYGGGGGGLTGLVACGSYKFVHVTSATDTLLVQGVAAQTVRVCGMVAHFSGSAAQSVYMENTASVNANCTSTKTQIGALYTGNSTAPLSDGFLGGFWTGASNTAGNGVCLNSSGAGGVDVEIWYAQGS